MNAPVIALELNTDSAYIAWRIIDCCLREDVRSCVTRGSEATPSEAVVRAWPQSLQFDAWWRIGHWPGGTVWLPVRRSRAMQDIAAVSDGWVRENDDGVHAESGADRWLEMIAQGLDEETVSLHRSYAEEAACAASHRALAREGYAGNAAKLVDCLDHDDWGQRTLRVDQAASYRDHPYYPTARAKSGFDESAMRCYAPEFDPSFELHWLAVPHAQLTQTTPPPAFWPRLRDVGLPAAMESTHAALPVHPLTWSRLAEFPLPDGAVRAPLTYLRVQPTLSVRTVMPNEHPHHHIKLPLLMRTLGALNLRLIKPSTLYDGHWFQQVLCAIAEHDPALHGSYVHVDEAHGGHVEDAKHLAYLVRSYPLELDASTLVPVAAFCAAMPDGRPLALHLVDRFHGGDIIAWWRTYARLLCDVHLRLWLVYGIALESNQQNAVLIYSGDRSPRLLMKDNDAARVLMPRLLSKLRDAGDFGMPRDQRIPVDDDHALARMFCTITLQLCLLAVLEGLAADDEGLREAMYTELREALTASLHALSAEGVDTAPAWNLLMAPRLPVKYLLSAGSLLSKRATGATDINKFYGESGPNFMLDTRNSSIELGCASEAA